MPQTRSETATSRMTAFVAICITVFILWAAYDVLMPIALSALLAFLLTPIVSRLERRGLPQVWAVIATVTLTFVLIGTATYVVGQQIYSLGAQLQETTTQKRIGDKKLIVDKYLNGFATKLSTFYGKVENATTQPSQKPVAAPAAEADDGAANASERPSVLDEASHPDDALANHVVRASPMRSPAPAGTTSGNPLYTVVLPGPYTPIETLGRYLGFVLGPLGTAGLVLVFVVFVLLEREQLRDRMIHLLSGGNYTNTTNAIHDATARITRYMLAQSIVNGSYGLIVGVGLWLIGRVLGGGDGFPSIALWALMCAILRFIPYIGPWTASAFPIAISLAFFDGFGVFAAVLAMFVIIELFSNNVMEPWLYGSSTGLSTVAIMVAAVFWTWLWGPIGLLLSTPLTVCIVVLGRYTTQLHFLDVLLSDRPALPPALRFYQRLLASDEREATAIVRAAAAESDWSRAADAVVVRALALARRDRRDENLTADEEGRLLTAVRAVRGHVDAEPKRVEPEPIDGGRPRVIAVPAHHRSEEAVLAWLAVGAVLDPVSVELGSTKMLAAQVIDRVEGERPAAVVIAVLPPGGLVQARYLCRRLRRRVPDVAIVVAYFGKPRHFDKLLNRLRGAGASYVTTSIEQTQRQILAVTSRRPAAASSTISPTDGTSR